MTNEAVQEYKKEGQGYSNSSKSKYIVLSIVRSVKTTNSF